MTSAIPDSETVHATCVAIGGQGVLLFGRSGSGKSDLALRLLDRGARLISDDYTILRNNEGKLLATAPATIAGKLEVRGVGIVDWSADADAEIALCVALDEPVERLPDIPVKSRSLMEVRVPTIALNALESSSPIKVELALRHLHPIGRPRQ